MDVSRPRVPGRARFESYPIVLEEDDEPYGAAPEMRVAAARARVLTPAETGPVVVWLGYQGGLSWHLRAGHVTFLDAHWAVPNTGPDGQDFEHRSELIELVEHGPLFKVSLTVDEPSDVDGLVRVDLGETTTVGAVERAVEIVDTILNVSIHRSGGARPHLMQYGVLQSGRVGPANFMVARPETGFPDDRYGAHITADAIRAFGPPIADALMRHDLPRFLVAAIDVQKIADRPFSRETALRTPSELDLTSVIPLADRVVQHVAAYAGVTGDTVFDLLGARWPHLIWLTDIRRAVDLCLVGDGTSSELRDQLISEWYSDRLDRPWVLFVTEHADDLIILCRIESDRPWIKRMFHSITDHNTYDTLITDYTRRRDTLETRRRRTRNALVHGSPASFAVVDSARPYAEYLSGSATHLALKAYVDGTEPIDALRGQTAEHVAMSNGTDAATYWRSRAASDPDGLGWDT